MSGLAFVYDIRMPKKFTELANYLSAAVNVDFISFMPIGCMTPTNFHSSLVGYTAGFLLVFAVMLAAWACNRKSKPEFANKIFGYFLALTFLVLPSISIKIFSTFACRTFDGEYGSFLKVDYSIDCMSDEHKLAEKYALVMVLFYPVGIPVMYLVLLYRKRALLDPGQVKFTHELGDEQKGMEKAMEERTKLEEDDPSLASLSFLYSAYEPQCWWFEIIASMILCLGAMRLYAGYAPFIEQSNDTLAECAQWQLFFTMFAALCIRVQVDGESLQDRLMFDYFLCALQFAAVAVGIVNIVYAIYHGYQEDKETLQDLRGKSQSKIVPVAGKSANPDAAADDDEEEDEEVAIAPITGEEDDGEVSLEEKLALAEARAEAKAAEADAKAAEADALKVALAEAEGELLRLKPE
ncbi:hypothetical protein TeGR_g10141 [Tetraparma gracilis]|uniref:Uncharacterized protein n=1 Tax=Tetraparma gracilis TaxID=2962635 RepID=A0ABQ6M6S6_9STRA|nr:hypothetical protein TeGR_g10141 [Tetraparma gracilis]